MDADGDGYGDPSSPIEACVQPEGTVANDDDCDDSDGTAHGDTWYADADEDGYGTMAGATLSCSRPSGASDSWLDCDDADPDIHPDATDLPEDGIDQDCNGRDAQPVEEEPSTDTGEPADTGAGEDTAAPAEEQEQPDGDPAVDEGDDPHAPQLGDQAQAVEVAPRGRGCGCSATSGGGAPWVLLLLAGLALGRRRDPEGWRGGVQTDSQEPRPHITQRTRD